MVTSVKRQQFGKMHMNRTNAVLAPLKASHIVNEEGFGRWK